MSCERIGKKAGTCDIILPNTKATEAKLNFKKLANQFSEKSEQHDPSVPGKFVENRIYETMQNYPKDFTPQ